MAVQITCPHCGGSLRSQKPVAAGAKISCPKCHSAFQVPGQEGVTNRLAPQQSQRQQNGVNPAVASAPKRSKPITEEDEFEDQKHRKKSDARRAQGKKKARGKSNALLFGILGGVGAVVIAGGVIAFILISNSGNTGGNNNNNSLFNIGNNNPGQGNDPKKQLQESTCVYDDSLTKYLPKETSSLRVIDFSQARTHNILAPMAEVIQRDMDFGSWEGKHLERISVLTKAGIARESLKSITHVWTGPVPEYNPFFLQFTVPPDQKKLIEALFYQPVQMEGKTIYKMRPSKAGDNPNFTCAYFLKPDLFVFGPSEKSVLSVIQTREPPVVSPDLIQTIKLTRGPLPQVSLRTLGAGKFHYFQKGVNYGDWFGKPKAYAIWYLPGQGEVHAYHGYLYSDEKRAAEAEEKSKKVIKDLIASFEATHPKTLPLQIPAAREMYTKLTTIREGSAVIASWPLRPILIERFFGFKGHGLKID